MAQPTLGMQFVAQLKALMDKLNATKPHFIKCLKPNMQKQVIPINATHAGLLSDHLRIFLNDLF
jgi:myosin heavy subunit